MLFNKDECKTIEDAICAAEKKTSGEIVVMTVNKAGTYESSLWKISFAAATVVAFLFIYILPETFFQNKPRSFMMAAILYMQILFFFLLLLFFNICSVAGRLVVGKKTLEITVRNRAGRAFYEHGLNRTKDGTGVLILLCSWERRIYICADYGIYEKITQNGLNDCINDITTGLKEKRGAEAIAAAVGKIGSLLAQYFPVQPNDVNELPNAVIQSEKL